jgi:type VI secretion system protein ImpJ
MKFLSRVVWSEGMHLGPHHFQAQSRYFEDTLWFLHGNLHPFPWGLIHYSIDTEALRNGTAILNFASGVFPDGLIFDFPESDTAPEPVRLATVFSPSDSEVTLHLAIPSRRQDGRDCDPTGDGVARYGIDPRDLRDDTLGGDEYRVTLGRKNLKLLTDAQLSQAMVAVPIARILRDGHGGFLADAEFIPPCLRIGASQPLVAMLFRLVQAIEAKLTSMRGLRRNTRGLELGTSALDVANYWFLHALASELPVLRHHLQDRFCHPESVYIGLARLAGSLSTFSLEARVEEIGAYNHLDLTDTFSRLEKLIRAHLEVVVPTNQVVLQFRPSAPYMHVADVTDERCLRRARWIFGIRCRQPDSIVLRDTPRLVKVCSAEGVGKLVQRALPGLELTHLPVPPAALSAQADMHYFSLSAAGPCWQHILQTRQVGVYIPGEFGSAGFEISVIVESGA